MQLPDDPLQGDPLQVYVGDKEPKRFTGWKSLEVMRPLDAATGSFSLTFGPDLVRGFPVLPGDRVKIVVGTEVLLDGYCDAIRADTESSDDAAEGRDKTADLVDATVEKQLSLAGPAATLERVAHDIAAQFDIRVDFRAKQLIHPLNYFATTPGETAWTAIDRAARVAGVLVYSEGLESGLRVVIADAGAAGRSIGELVQGEGGRVVSAQRVDDNTERFDTYIVRGQQFPVDPEDVGNAFAIVEGKATDEGVGRRRPLVIVAESTMTAEDAKRRAQWESVRRAARAQRLTVVVPGWRQLGERGTEGPLWKVNQIVPTRIPRLHVNADLLLNRARFRRSRDGTFTTLELVRPDAFTLLPEIPDQNPLFAGEDDE